MDSVEMAFEKYKFGIADSVFNNKTVQSEMETATANLRQRSFAEPIPDDLKRAFKDVVVKVVDTLLSQGQIKIDTTIPAYKKDLANKLEDILRPLDGDSPLSDEKNKLKVAFIRAIGTDNQNGRWSLMNNFELSFGLFVNVVAQITCVQTNKLNPNVITPTPEEIAEHQGRILRESVKKGGKVTIVNAGKEKPEELAERLVSEIQEEENKKN